MLLFVDGRSMLFLCTCSRFRLLGNSLVVALSFFSFPFMKPVVLIAEDDAFFRETIQLSLEEHGIEVKLAKNGEEAMAMIDEARPNLLLLDLLMPRKDGFAVLQHVKDKKYTFPIIILSNLSDEMDDERCKELGVKDYYIKSDMDEDELWPKISAYLS